MFSYCDCRHEPLKRKLYKRILNKKSPLQAHINDRVRDEKTGKRMYKTTLSGHGEGGSASVEAAIVMPLFIWAVLGILSVAGVIHTKAVVYEGLHETALYMAECSFLSEQAGKGVDVGPEAKLLEGGMSIVTANKKIRDYIDDRQLIDRYVDGSMSGLRIVQTELKQDDCVYIKLVYDVCINIPVIGRVKIPCEERIRQRAYLGYSKDNDKDAEGTYVYVTENGTVYHRSRSCYHIKLTIRQVSPSAVEKECSGLTKCRLCKRYMGRGTIYVTKSGDRYHYSLECPGLKRTVYRVKKDDCGGLGPCSECGQ